MGIPIAGAVDHQQLTIRSQVMLATRTMKCSTMLSLLVLVCLSCFALQAGADGVEVKVCCLTEEAYTSCEQMRESFFAGEGGEGGAGAESGAEGGEGGEEAAEVEEPQGPSEEDLMASRVNDAFSRISIGGGGGGGDFVVGGGGGGFDFSSLNDDDDDDDKDSGDSGDDGGSSSSKSKKEKKKKTERKRSRSSSSGGGTFPSTSGGGGGGADDGGSSDDDGGAGDDSGSGDDGGQTDDDGGGDDGRRKLLAGHITWQCIKPGGAAPDGGRRLLAEGNVSASVMQMLEKKECNLATDLDARDVYQANKALGYQAIFAEDSKGDGEGRTFHAVAVVPASTCEANPNVTLVDLKGGNACSAGYKQTSGWTIPLATMLTQGDGSNTEELGKADWEAMTSFFPQMCSPGGPEEADEKLCANCAGDCESGDGEPYSGHAGSMRCLMEGKGDVAFTKETAPLDFAADVKLVCPNGGCADVADHDTCNYATVPTNMVAVSPDLPVDEIRSQMMEKMNSQEWSDWLASNPSLFKGGSKGLVPIQEDTVEYMGNIADVYQSLENLGYL